MKQFDLSEKTAVITGGAGLFGQIHAESIADLGGKVILLDKNKRGLKSVIEELNKKYHGAVSGIGADVTDTAQIKSALKQILKNNGQCHILVNNAATNPKVEGKGLSRNSLLENFAFGQWEKEIAVGLTGAFLCTQIFGAHMAKKGSGNIINISSDLGLIGPDQRIYNPKSKKRLHAKPVTYSVIKHGLIGLTRYTATYWAQQGVRCNALAPGGIFTHQDQGFVKRLTQLIPQGRMACPDDYKGAMQFLASDASRYMTGQVLVVDGGRTCW